MSKLIPFYGTNVPNQQIRAPEFQDNAISSLPDEILLKIFKYLKLPDLLACSKTCRRFYPISNDNGMWTSLFKHTFSQGNMPDKMSAKEALIAADSFHKNALWGQCSHRLVMSAPKGVELIGLAKNGTQVIGWKDRAVYIYDLQQNTTTVFKPEIDPGFNLIKMEELGPGKFALIFQRMHINVPGNVFAPAMHVKLFDLAKGTTILSTRYSQLCLLKNGKMGIVLCGRERTCLKIYDPHSEADPFELQCDLEINDVFELVEGEITILSGNNIGAALEVWNLKTQQCIHPLLNVIDNDERVPLKDGRLVLFNLDGSQFMVYNPSSHSTEYVDDPDDSLLDIYLKNKQLPENNFWNRHIDYSGKLFFSPQDRDLNYIGSDGVSSIPIMNLNNLKVSDATFSFNALTILACKEVRRLNFGKHHEILDQLTDDFSKVIRVRDILKKTQEKVACSINGYKKQNQFNDLLSLILARKIDHIFAPVDFRLKKNNFDHAHTLTLTNITPMNVEIHIFEGDFSSLADLQLFRKWAEELNQIKRVNLGFIKRFNLLPESLRKPIYGKLEEIIASKGGNSNGHDAFHKVNGQTSTEEECLEAIQTYLKEQKYEAEEISYIPPEPEITLWENPPEG